jgi:hypothetical protein
MHLCYIDEAGDSSSLKSATDTNQPVLVIGGLIVNHPSLPALTHDFLALKRNLYPGLARHSWHHYHAPIAHETKGSELRKHIARGTRAESRHAIRFLDAVRDLPFKHHVELIARVWVKSIGQQFLGLPVYSSSVQALCTYFQEYLKRHNDFGVVVADSRDPVNNSNVAHSIFTQKFHPRGDRYDRICELPAFAHSENHAVIQLCDIVCSGLISPISTYVYCTGYVHNVHVQPNYKILKDRYAIHLNDLQFRYQLPGGKYVGGIVTNDGLSQRSGNLMFK